MQSPPFPRYLGPPRSKYSPQHHVLKNPQLPFLPQCQRPREINCLLLIYGNKENVQNYMCLRFNDLDLCYWSQENIDTGHGTIRNIQRSNESCRLGIFRIGFETDTTFVPFDDRISSSLQCNKCQGKGRRIAIRNFKLSNR